MGAFIWRVGKFEFVHEKKENRQISISPRKANITNSYISSSEKEALPFFGWPHSLLIMLIIGVENNIGWQDSFVGKANGCISTSPGKAHITSSYIPSSQKSE